MQKKPSIINIINFVRGVEPREPMDLHMPVRQQLRLLKEHGMRGTFLMQYDALLDGEFIKMLKDTDHEIGVWLEIVRPMCEAVSIAWRGRFPWDWHSHVGFSVGYSKEEREKLCDEVMRLFKSIFGRYPASVGSWMIDAHTLQYLAQKYGVSASCNCKDQWGTDGYTLWGGYYGQAYYPSKNNAYAPAQAMENQIPIPVFKMLGSDPVYQYDFGLSTREGSADWQGVVTLEPVYESQGGGNPEWVRWFFSEVMSSCCVSFRYAQAGQENSFGWPAMEKGLIDQFEWMAKLVASGELRVETLEASAVWFQKTYAETPNSAITALSDWMDSGKKSIWFSTKRYRINLYAEGERLWIRDLMLFDDEYRERYLDGVCESPIMVYDNLPIMDGNRFSGGGVRAGGYLLCGEAELRLQNLVVREEGERLIAKAVTDKGALTFTLDTNTVHISADFDDLRIVPRWGTSAELDGAHADKGAVHFTHEGMEYQLRLNAGRVEDCALVATNRELELAF